MAQMRRIPLLFALALSLAGLAGCGDSEDEPESNATGGDPAAARDGIAGDADPDVVKVISMWSRELRRGDIGAAADLFAIPSLAENAPIRIRIESRHDAELFNASLPCGGRLIRAEEEGGYTTATFRLTERPGAGRCGNGTGETAKTAFVIRDGLIVEWRRVGLGPPTTPGQQI
jgi:hypothetical protein